MAANARSNKMTSGKTEQYPFSWKISSGWDFSIGVAETATNAVMANVMKFRVAATCRNKLKEFFQYFFACRNQLWNIKRNKKKNSSKVNPVSLNLFLVMQVWNF